jgi:cytochrome c biogenesis protein CcmG, thiol:disulfide interchange protein DsbE
VAKKVVKQAKDRKRFEKVMAIAAGVLVVGGLLFAFAPDSLWGSGAPAIGSDRKAAPQISMPDIKGGAWNLSDHRGKVVLVNFWATWCGPCRRETPDLVNVANQLGPKGLEVVGVSLDQTKDVIPPFVAQYNIPYPILLSPPGSSLTAQIRSIPTTLLIDKQGRVAKQYVGAVTESVFRQDIKQLLAE